MRLYEIQSAIETLINVAMPQDTEGCDLAPDTVARDLEALELAREEKYAGCCAYIKNLEAEHEAIDQEIDRLQRKQGVLESRLHRFESYLSYWLPKDLKWSNGVHQINWHKSKQVSILDEKLLAPEFIRERITREPDKIKLKNFLRTGEVLPGAELVEESRLQIK